MQVKSIAECFQGEHSAILSTFIKLPFVIKIFVLSIFEWPFYIGFTLMFFFYRKHEWQQDGQCQGSVISVPEEFTSRLLFQHCQLWKQIQLSI